VDEGSQTVVLPFVSPVVYGKMICDTSS